VHDGDLAALVPDGVVEGELGDAAAFGAGVDARRDRHCVRIIAYGEVVLPGDVEALEVFAHEDDVDVFIAPAGHEGARWPQVGIQAELLAQPHVHRAEASADRRGERTLEREAGAANALEEHRRQRVVVLRDRRHATLVALPREWRAGRVEN
jgi:hypothetical protein